MHKFLLVDFLKKLATMQVIGNYTTNVMEGWMQIRCKFDDGKVVNAVTKWVMGTVTLGYSNSKTWGEAGDHSLVKQKTRSSPNQVLTDTAESTASIVQTTRKQRAT